MMTEEIYFEQAHGRLQDALIESPNDDDEIWGDASNWPIGGWWDRERPRLGHGMRREEFWDDVDDDDQVVGF